MSRFRPACRTSVRANLRSGRREERPAPGTIGPRSSRRNLLPNLLEISCEVLIGGAGAGGIAAALRLLERGHSVCLTEETDTIGGQFVVPALDEHKFIEISGATRSYHDFRKAFAITIGKLTI